MKINKKRLTEDIFDKASSSEEFADGLASFSDGGGVLYDYDNIYDYLDSLYEINKALMRVSKHIDMLPLNILLMGPAGIAKSGIIKTWASRHKEIRVTKFTGSQLDTDTVKGVAKAGERPIDPSNPDAGTEDYFKYILSDLWDQLNTPGKNNILFIDELNRSYTDCRASILDIVLSHEVTGKGEDGSNHKYLNNFVMTIACCNPPDKNHKGADRLDNAMMTRFSIFNMHQNLKFNVDYWQNLMEAALKAIEQMKVDGIDDNGKEYTDKEYRFDKNMWSNCLKIVKKILKVGNDIFDQTILDKEGNIAKDEIAEKMAKGHNISNARSLYSAVLGSMGNPTIFLNQTLPKFCGIMRNSEKWKKIEIALKAPDDKDDVTNAWKDDTKSAYDRIVAFEREKGL